ncbi:MAG TPA: glycerophosphodiester phosphodiesterase family protein [Nevskiaceae bacterium]|nr:glycerophosphodiester phosphodiesterase family protein [Nevskiaceae bacterium]
MEAYLPVALFSALTLSACMAGSMPPAQESSAAAPPPVKFAPFISGHRGGSGYAPEDTLTAYRNAARLGIDDFETDTVPTKDGVLVLIHDDSVDRTTNCSGKVNSFNYADIIQCDAGYWWTPGQSTTPSTHDDTLPHPFRGKGVVLPRAEDLFAYARSLGPDGPTVTIEIKNGPNEAQYEVACPTTAARLVDLIHQSGIQPRIVVQSFDPTCIATVKQLDPTVQTLYLSEYGALDDLAVCVAGGHDYSAPPYNSVDFTQAYVNLAHAQNVKVDPWTVDTQADLQHMIDLGVDGVITNFPACMLQLQGRPVPANVVAPEGGYSDPAFKVCG